MISYDEITKTINFDSTDGIGMRKLMERANEFSEPCVGKNKENEKVMISINSDNITTETFQSNGWLRTNVYWADGTREELFEKC